MRKVDPSFEWKMPINFFGKVVDQDNLPLPGADIRFVWNDTSSRGTSESKTTSASNGRFALADQRGKGLSVYVSKEGYHTSGGIGGMSFEYAAFFEGNYHQPDPESPVTFRLIKKLEAEPLVARRVSQYLPAAYDGETYFYDPRSGTLGRVCPLGGALKLNFERSQSPRGQLFDWTWTVEAVNGGLQETKDEFAQLAPENGYVGSWQMSEAATMQPFRRGAKADFYVRTADNHYARVDIELSHPNSRSAGPNLRVSSFLNPSGSRNLEFDPAKEIKPK
jgi:hypothetical protein